MKKSSLVLLATSVVFIVFVVGITTLSASVLDSLDIRVTERFSNELMDNTVNSSVKLVISNKWPINVGVFDAEIITYFGGSLLGFTRLEPFKIEGNTIKTVVISIEEDWSQVALMEPHNGLTFNLDLKTQICFLRNTLNVRNKSIT